MELTNKPSMERPWTKLYPPPLLAMRDTLAEIQGKFTLVQYLSGCVTKKDLPVVEYYGKTYTLQDLLDESEKVGASMAAMGLKCGDKVCALLDSVPEILIVLFACEKLGVQLICRNNVRKENLDSVRTANPHIIFAPDFLSREDEEYYYRYSDLEHIVTISSRYYADWVQMPEHIRSNLDKLYNGPVCCDERTISWADFLEKGKQVDYNWHAPDDPKRPLCSPHTSGSTGSAKEIVHCAASILGVLTQISFPTADTGKTVLLTLFPPTITAILICIILYNISKMNRLILSPFCAEKDIDLELMRYRPWMMMTVPMMADTLWHSTRIPADYDMSYLKVLGGGADPANNKWLDRFNAWLASHNCSASFTQAYGQSECGASVCMPLGNNWYNGCVGAPLILTTVGIFDPDTEEELDYGQIGEVCIQSPGMMLGYGGVSAGTTDEVLRTHADGRRFVHSGDMGYMDPMGYVYIMGRGRPQRWGHPGKYIFALPIENRVVALDEIEDCYCITPADKYHPGHVLPYLFITPAPGCVLDDALRAKILSVLEPHEYPVDIRISQGRTYFAFKLNRRGMAAQLRAEQD